MEFHKLRRQQFLTEDVFKAQTDFFNNDLAPAIIKVLENPPRNSMDHSLNATAYADQCFSIYLMTYTAGDSLNALREDLDHIVFSFERAAIYIRDYQSDATFPPLLFVEIDEYERVLQLIGLIFLLHRRDLLPRVAALFDPSYAEKDLLYEDMLSFEMEGRFEIDSWYHEMYRPIIEALYQDTEAKIISDFERYIKKWYKSLEEAPWHDSHLRIEDSMSAGYFGYWAIEAAALVYLMEVDDSSFRDHLVYPKDLVDYAYSLDERSASTLGLQANSNSNRRVSGGGPCPASGYWMTPARLNSRQYFKMGDVMPIFYNSSFGATIWQWSEEQ